MYVQYIWIYINTLEYLFYCLILFLIVFIKYLLIVLSQDSCEYESMGIYKSIGHDIFKTTHMPLPSN